MKTKLQEEPKGPTPKAKLEPLIAVYSVRNIDGEDVAPGVYSPKPGQYVSAVCRNGIPIGKITKLTSRQAFDQMQKLRDEFAPRPGVDVWNELEPRLVRETLRLEPVIAGQVSDCFRGVYLDAWKGGFYRATLYRSYPRLDELVDVQPVDLASALLAAAEGVRVCDSLDTGRLAELLEFAGVALNGKGAR